MSLTVNCPDCGRSRPLPESQLGRRTRCKDCGARFLVATADPEIPAAEPEPAPATILHGTLDPPLAEYDDDPPSPRYVPPPRPRTADPPVAEYDDDPPSPRLIPPPRYVPPPPPRQYTPPPPEPEVELIEAACPLCSKVYLVPKDRLGKRARCKACGTLYRLGESVAMLDESSGSTEVEAILTRLPIPSPSFDLPKPRLKPAPVSTAGRPFVPFARARSVVGVVVAVAIVVPAVWAAYRAMKAFDEPATTFASSDARAREARPFQDDPVDVPPTRDAVVAEHDPFRAEVLSAFEELATAAKGLEDPATGPAASQRMQAAFERVRKAEAEEQRKTPLNPAESAELNKRYGEPVLAKMRETREVFDRLSRLEQFRGKLDGPIREMNQGIEELARDVRAANALMPTIDVIIYDVEGGQEACEAVIRGLGRFVDTPPGVVRVAGIGTFDGVSEAGVRVGPVSDPSAFAKRIGTYEAVLKRRVLLKNPRPTEEDLLAVRSIASEREATRKREEAARLERDRLEREKRAEGEREELDRTLADLATGEEGKVEASIGALGRLTPSDSRRREVTAALTKTSKGIKPARRPEFVRTALRWAGPEDVDFLIELAPESNGFELGGLVEKLLEIGNPRAIPTLASHCDQLGLRDVIVAFFKKHPDPAGAALRENLSNSNPSVRRGAMEALAALGGQRNLDALEKAAKTDTDLTARDLAARLVRRVRGSR